MGLIMLALSLLLTSFKSAYLSTANSDGAVKADTQDMRTVFYRGHSYIVYRFETHSRWDYRSYGYGGAGMVHDPDCTCHREK